MALPIPGWSISAKTQSGRTKILNMPAWLSCKLLSIVFFLYGKKTSCNTFVSLGGGGVVFLVFSLKAAHCVDCWNVPL